MNYLEVVGNDLHFTNHSDFERTIKVFNQNSIPYQIFDSCGSFGTIKKCVIVDRANKDFRRLKIGLIEATKENVIKVKLRQIKHLINETIEVRNNTSFHFDIQDKYLAFRAGYLRKQEIELLNQQNEIFKQLSQQQKSEI